MHPTAPIPRMLWAGTLNSAETPSCWRGIWENWEATRERSNPVLAAIQKNYRSAGSVGGDRHLGNLGLAPPSRRLCPRPVLLLLRLHCLTADERACAHRIFSLARAWGRYLRREGQKTAAVPV